MNKQAQQQIDRISIRRKWLESSKRGLDKGVILDILVYKDVRLIDREISMAEALENVALYGAKPPAGQLEWYEEAYLKFAKDVVNGQRGD